MRYWIAALCAALLACLAPAPAAAAPGIPASCPRADGAYITCTPVVVVDPVTGLPLPGGYVTDPNNASYTFGNPLTTATGSFKVLSADASATTTRAVSVVCATGLSETLTLTGPNGNTWSDYVSGPKNYDPVQAVSFTGNSAGCTVQGFY